MSLSAKELKNLLKTHNVAGVSFAVLRDFHFAYAQCEGFINNESQEPLWPDSLFQGASISKILSAVLTMILVERGKLDLDKPVNKYLKSWKLPENEWTKDTPVTLRHILSHFSGINVPTYRGFLKEDPIPTFKDVLNGTGPCDAPAVIVEEPVNEQFIYSTGAFAVLQMVLEDVTNESFETLVQHELLQPLNMHRTLFAQPLPEYLSENTACGHRSDGELVAGNWFVYPTQAGSGVWTTPTDLAKFALHLQKILLDDSSELLQLQTLREMISPYREPFFGLGFALYNDKGPGMFFGHTGNTEGYRSMFIAHESSGGGAFILANSDNADPVIREVINQIARSEGWEGFRW
ncbi:MAG: beta-lactamase family protein [Candidatus Riflebacteria bacterium]|nr:beta-lactamase family protein [Candidatus Riflebacteria bacterium]